MVSEKEQGGFGKFQESMRDKRLVLFDDPPKDKKLYSQLKNRISASRRVMVQTHSTISTKQP